MEDRSPVNVTIDMDTSSDEDEYDENEENEHILDENEIIEEPKVGMIFSSPEDVHHYYKNYAKKEGFGIAKRSLGREDDGIVRYFTIECSRGGKKRERAKNSLRPQFSAKTECNAKIRSTLQRDGRFMLTTVVLEHNHTLSPGKARYFGEKDCRNYIEKARRLRLRDGDVQAVCNYFVRMQDKNSSFFYVMDFDEENRIRNLFWADARSRAAYEAFGDVVTFDTMYLTNRYEMPFVLFVGVNHHGQSVLLGCGLLSNEDTETFVWLFQSWLACMSNCPPKAVITDQCKAMQKAVEIVFPNTRHRWCLWHIMKKIPHKLSGYYQYETIKTSLQNAVYDSLTKDGFEEGWTRMIDKYDLHDNEWLRGLYDDRHRWVPIYVKDTFWAGMSTTQCSESMNAFFDGYVHSKTSLKQFVKQYNNALKNKIEKENKADFRSFHLMYECVSKRYFEKQFQEAYTNAKFKEFQEELKRTMYCHPSLVKEEDSILTYEVVEEVKIGDIWKDVVFIVDFNELQCEVKCMCNLFEFKGIICGHALSVFAERRVNEVPPKYILSRWRKDLKRDYNFVKINYDNSSLKSNGLRYDELFKEFYEVAKIAVDFEERGNILMSNMRQLKNKFLSEVSVCGSNQTPQVALVASPKSADDYNGLSKASSKESKVDEVVRRKLKGRKKKQQVEDGGTKKQKRNKGSSQEEVVKKGGIDDEVKPPTPNTSCMVNEIGIQDSVNNPCGFLGHSHVMNPPIVNQSQEIANPSSFLGGSYVVVPSTSNQFQGHLTQIWRGGYGMGNLNLLQNLSQGFPSQFWSGGYPWLHVNRGSFIENPSQNVRNSFHPNPNQQP